MGARSDYVLTEAGEAALGVEDQRMANLTVQPGDTFETFTPSDRYHNTRKDGPKSVRQQVLDEALDNLQEAFPAWTIWFAKISYNTTVWTATHPAAPGAVQEYSAAALTERLIPLNARLAS